MQIHAKSLPLQSISPKTIIIKTTYNEKNIPTFPPQACQQARLPRKNGFGQRPPRPFGPPSSLPQETHRLRRRPLVVPGLDLQKRLPILSGGVFIITARGRQVPETQYLTHFALVKNPYGKTRITLKHNNLSPTLQMQILVNLFSRSTSLCLKMLSQLTPFLLGQLEHVVNVFQMQVSKEDTRKL